MGSRIAGLTHLKSGQPIDSTRDYVVAGWASVNQSTEGPPVWELVEKYVAARKTVQVEPNTSVNVVGG
jgi:sulfur-oxidizing protein SoxB